MKITTEARIEVTTLREIRGRVSTEFALLASILRSSGQKKDRKGKLDLYCSLAAPPPPSNHPKASYLYSLS